MTANANDNLGTIAAMGLIAYLCADVAHHALGHGAACLALGGRVNLLSSVFVDCSLRGSAIDLAGPCANLALGLLAALLLRGTPPARDTPRLFLFFLAAFNLFWFCLQLAYSVADRTDDWAWAMQEYRVGGPLRWGAILSGLLAYAMTIRMLSSSVASYADTRRRVVHIMLTAWLAAGGIACATAAFDDHPLASLLRHAAPQSLLLSAGLLLVPAAARRRHVPGTAAAPVARSPYWIAAAALSAVLSIHYLGPGISVGL